MRNRQSQKHFIWMLRCGVVLGLVLLSSGCAALTGHHKISGKKDGPSDVYPGPSEVVWVSEDTPMMSVQGTTVTAVDHRQFTRGSYGAVLPMGAKLSGVDLETHPTAKRSGSEAPLAHMNPWVYVRVEESRYASQVGWEGWVHNSALSYQQTSEPAPPELSLERASKLCPSAQANSMQCSQRIAAGTDVRLIACAQKRAHIEFWIADGRYTNGFINQTQLSKNPCP